MNEMPISDVNAEPPQQVVQLVPKVIETNESQGLDLKDQNQLVRFIGQLIKAKALPKHLSSESEVLSAWNFASQLKLPPQVSLKNIAVINGSPSLFGDLPLALVQRHIDFISYEEFCIDKEYNKICFENKNLDADIFGGVVFFERRGSPKQSFSFTIADANRAGLISKAGNGMPWRTYPQIMVVRRARIIGIKALFADALTGATIAEDFGRAPDLEKDVTPTSISLNEKLS